MENKQGRNLPQVRLAVEGWEEVPFNDGRTLTCFSRSTASQLLENLQHEVQVRPFSTPSESQR
jgi:hypothetical protein